MPNYRQQGVSLLENMVALLIFSLGILGLIGMLATSIKINSDTGYRNDASFLASQLIGRMWVDDRTNAALKAGYESPSGPKFLAWKAQVEKALPNVETYPPTIAIDAQNVAVITVQWMAPGKAAPSRYTISTGFSQ